jgi:uncharacterized RDD family membrane protein YckC
VSERVAWGQQAYAGFWQRAGGYAVDSLIFMAASFVILLVVFAATGPPEIVFDETGNPVGTGPMPFLWLPMGIAYFLYDVLMTSRYGWTLGKRAAGLEVRTKDGDLCSFGLAAGRFFARFISSIPLYLGFFWAGWDDRKQTWHDKICSTFVLRRELLVSAAAAQERQGAVQGWSDERSGWQQGTGASPAPVPGAGWGPPPPPAGWGAAQPSAWAPPGQGPGGPAAGSPVGESMESAQWGRRDVGTPPAGEDRDGAREPSTDTPAGAGDQRWPDEQPGSDQRWPDEQPGGDQRRPDEQAGGPGPVPHDAGSSFPPAPGVPAPASGPMPTGRPDPNLVAVDRAGMNQDSANWLRQVAQQVDPRLGRVNPDWHASPHAEAARACAFGILLGHLARMHPHMADDLSRVAEVHPSFATLLEGSRLETLQQIAAEPSRATAWLGPLIDVEDRDRIARMLE